MRKSFFDKMIIGYIIIAIAAFFIMVTFENIAIQYVLVHERKANLTSQASLVTMEYVKPYFTGECTEEELNSKLKILHNFLNSTIWISDKKGNVVATSSSDNNLPSENNNTNPESTENTENTESTNQQEIPNIYQFLTKEDTSRFYSSTSKFNTYFNGDTLTVCIPITKSNVLKGYIILHSSIESIKEIKSDLLNVTYIAFFTTILISFLFLYHFTNRIIIPFNKINNVAKLYSSGVFDTHLNIERDDEIGQLANSLNDMADELSKMDEYRKDFISNISHDFRSPLTSIKGYVEAMLDGTIPPEKQTKYLKIVLSETLRLTKLTEGILTLSDFDKFSPIIKRLNFDMIDTIQQTIATFEGTAARKNVSITSSFPSEKLSVYADKSKIQQVIYNLLDNAIKFSPENSTICISITSKKDHIEVSIQDQGQGIKKDEQKKIWDRFYKADSSRGKDKQGTGLGLSIVKEIINAHGESITLSSEENEGCEFVFTLPKSS